MEYDYLQIEDEKKLKEIVKSYLESMITYNQFVESLNKNGFDPKYNKYIDEKRMLGLKNNDIINYNYLKDRMDELPVIRDKKYIKEVLKFFNIIYLLKNDELFYCLHRNYSDDEIVLNMLKKYNNKVFRRFLIPEPILHSIIDNDKNVKISNDDIYSKFLKLYDEKIIFKKELIYIRGIIYNKRARN